MKYRPVDLNVANRGTFPPGLLICSGITWMISMSRTGNLKLKRSINREIIKFTSGLCKWRVFFCCELVSQLHHKCFWSNHVHCLLTFLLWKIGYGHISTTLGRTLSRVKSRDVNWFSKSFDKGDIIIKNANGEIVY